jgi:nucleotide-binding universal stress UspA family protein
MSQPPYKRILVVVDSRPVSRVAVKTGIALAASHQAHIVFFHVMPRYSMPMADMPPFVAMSPQDFLRDAQAIADRLLSAAASAAKRAGLHAQTASGSGDDDAHCIADVASKRRCELIVVASEGRNALLRLLTGSVIPGLITAAPMPVLVVKESARSEVADESTVVPIKPRRASARLAAKTPAAAAKPRRVRSAL